MFSEEELKKMDYQIKTEELIKETLFLRQYGTSNKNKEEKQNEEFFNKE